MKLKSNIKKDYLYLFLSTAGLSNAIWVLYLAYKGMSLVEIGLLESIFHITSFTMELPTGIVADYFGRKTSRIIGRIMACLSTLLMIQTGTFIGFAIAFFIQALAYNLESGAGDALIYDTLLTLEEEKDYMKIKGRQEWSYQIASVFSMLVGGYVATYSYELAYMITLAINILALIQSLSFVEPTLHKEASEKRPSVISHIKDSLQAIHDNRQIMTYVFFIECFSVFYTTIYFYIQNYFKSIGHNEFWIGSVIALASMASLLASTNAYKIEKYLGREALIYYAGILALVLFGVVGFTKLDTFGFIGLTMMESLLFVVFSDYINQLIPSESRATLLSFKAMIFSIMMVILFPIIGWIADHYGFDRAFQTMFIISIPVMLYTGYKLHKELNQKII
jgi:MFS family permease